jgi:hypothetical protein
VRADDSGGTTASGGTPVSSGGSPTGGTPGSGGITIDAGTGGLPEAGSIRCANVSSNFPAFDRECANAESCVLVSHQKDCCGTISAMAINRDARPQFDVAEGTCRAQYPLCGCASQGVILDDGTLVNAIEQAVVECVEGRCASRFDGPTFSCGPKKCTSDQFCMQSTGGPAGSPTTYACAHDPACARSCASCSATGCTCNSAQGHTTITCQYP